MTDFKSLNNGARELELDSLDGREDFEHNDFGSVEICKLFVARDVFFFVAISFDRVCWPMRPAQPYLPKSPLMLPLRLVLNVHVTSRQ